MTLSSKDALEFVNDVMLPAFKKERERLNRIDRWLRWEHDSPHKPRQATKEYKDLADRAQTPWLGLVVTSVAQALYVDGYRRADDESNASGWEFWQANALDARQIAIHRSALGYGLAYESVLPGEDQFGAPMPVMKGHSPRRMIAVYQEPENDPWPMFALQVEPTNDRKDGWTLRLYDQQDVHFLQTDKALSSVQWMELRTHGLGVCPVVRFANQLDLEGRADGEVEPFIPLASRIDQTTFDRLVVQRFSSWVVRTIAGMAKPDGTDVELEKMRLKVEDILVAEEPDTKFGSLPATPLDGFIKAGEADIRALAAVTQTPAHELLGQMANLSAEALAAARASLTAKVEERQQMFGESHEQALRLAALAMGDTDGAKDQSAQVQWRDTEIRSLAQAADALGKLAKMLSVPVELLWEKVPGFTQQDVERAKAIVAEGDSITELTRLLERQANEPEPMPMPAGPPPAA